MGRSRLGKARWGVLLLAAVAALGFGGHAVSADGSCAGDCVLGQLTASGGGTPTVGAGTAQSIGGQASSVIFTLTNESDDPLGSAQLVPPSGFSIAAATQTADGDGDGSVEVQVVNNVLELADLDLGHSISVRLSVTASCNPSSSTPWGLTAYTSDGYGQGRSLTLDSSSPLTVGVSGSCQLTFATPPSNAVTGGNITGNSFDQSGPSVAVAAGDANGAPINGVDVQLVAELGTGALSGSTLVETGTPPEPNGIAAFSPISITATGYYQLDASAPAFTPALSAPFMITDTATPCGTNCSGVTQSTSVALGASVSQPPSGDVLSLGLGGFAYQCPDPSSPTGYYREVTGALGVDVWTSTGTIDTSQLYEVVTITISKQLVQQSPNNGAPFYQVCYASTQPFAGSVDIGSVIPGPYTGTYVGLLPDCPSKHASAGDAPCVLSRNKTHAGQVVITYLAGPGDVWGSA